MGAGRGWSVRDGSSQDWYLRAVAGELGSVARGGGWVSFPLPVSPSLHIFLVFLYMVSPAQRDQISYIWAQDPSQSAKLFVSRASRGVGPQLSLRHFCHILLGKANHRPAQMGRGGRPHRGRLSGGLSLIRTPTPPASDRGWGLVLSSAETSTETQVSLPDIVCTRAPIPLREHCSPRPVEMTKSPRQ